MKKEKVTLVILVNNEIKSIQKLYPRIPFNAVEETIVIDPGSNDGTIEFLTKKGLKVIIQKKRGRGNAFIESINHTKHENLIFFSGDGNEDATDIPKIAEYLKQGYDLVIGCRFLLKGSHSDDSDDPLLIRKYGNIILSGIARYIWNTRVIDSINGFRGMKKKAMLAMNLDSQKHEIEIQSTVRAAKLELKIKEFPTKELLRLGGTRKQTAGTLTLGWHFLKFFIKEIKIANSFYNGKKINQVK